MTEAYHRALEHLAMVAQPALALAPRTYLEDLCANLAAEGLPTVVMRPGPDLRLADEAGAAAGDFGRGSLRLRRPARPPALG